MWWFMARLVLIPSAKESWFCVYIYGFATGMVYSSRTLHWCRRGHFFFGVSVSRIRWILMRSYCHKRGTASKRYSARGYFFQAWSKRFPIKGYQTDIVFGCVLPLQVCTIAMSEPRTTCSSNSVALGKADFLFVACCIYRYTRNLSKSL